MDSSCHGSLTEVGSKSILGPIFMFNFCSICARTGTFQACLPTHKRREVGPTKKKFTGPQYKSIPLVCCRSQPRLPTFVISEHLELGAAGCSGRPMKWFCHQPGHKGVAAEKGPRQCMPPGGVRWAWGGRSAGQHVVDLMPRPKLTPF